MMYYSTVGELMAALPHMSDEELKEQFAWAKMWLRTTKDFIKRGDKTAEEYLPGRKKAKSVIEKELRSRQKLNEKKTLL